VYAVKADRVTFHTSTALASVLTMQSEVVVVAAEARSVAAYSGESRQSSQVRRHLLDKLARRKDALFLQPIVAIVAIDTSTKHSIEAR
jgi:hypothetical protein